MGDVLTWFTGLATLVGFVVQVFDLFPRFAKQRDVIVLLLVGVFVGSSLRAFDSAKITFDITITIGVAFLVVITAVILLSLLAAAFSSDARRRGEFYGVAALALLPLFVAVLAVGAAPQKDRQELEKERLNVSELNLLAARAAELGDSERAVMHLNTALDRFELKDPRRQVLQSRIDALRDSQVAPPPSSGLPK